MHRSPTFTGFRDYLWDVLPEAREHILREELGEVGSYGDVDLDAYRYMTTGFMHVLGQAAERGDRALVRRCVAMAEQMLAGGDPILDDVVQIRVFDRADHIPGLPELFREYAGPITRLRMACTEGPPAPSPVSPVTPAGKDGRPGPEAAAVRAWLWKQVPMTRYPLLSVELAEVRATMSLAAMTPERYVAEAVVREMVQEGLDLVKGRPDPELTEAAAAELELMIADPGLAALIRPHAAALVAESHRNPLLASYAGPLLRAFIQ